MNVVFKKVRAPQADNSGKPIILSDRTYEYRLKKVLKNMEDFGISSLVVYADKEHGSNFEYLTGFIPRFEEALQIINKDGSSFLMLGNENYNKAKFARVKSSGIKVPLFSLPNQPMGDFSIYTSKSLKDFIYECNKGKNIFFTSDVEQAIKRLSIE